MPKCRKCGREAQVYIGYAKLNLCSACFKEFFERKVRSTIDKYKMIERDDRVAVAISGGKDSAALLFVLRELFPELEMKAIHINLGIGGYSEECEEKVRELLNHVDAELILFDLRDELGVSIEDFKNTVYGRRICSPCGTIKRYLINKLAHQEGATKLATGHHLDDVVEVAFNNYMHGDVNQLARLKPVLPSTHPKFIVKVKPLWGVTEEETMLYALHQGLPFRTVECPLSSGARSSGRKKLIHQIEEEIPGFRHTFLKSHTARILPLLEKSVGGAKLVECEVCGMPSSERTCAFCKRIRLAKEARQAS